MDEFCDCEEYDNKEEIIINPFNKYNPIAENTSDYGQVYYYMVSVSEVASFLETWCFNRPINDDHLKKLKQEVLSQNHKHFMGSTQVIRDKSKNYRVINGQHRLKAIHEIMKEDFDMKFDMKIMIELYDLDIEDILDYNMSEENNNKIEMLFKNANNSLFLKPEDDREIFCKKIIMEMKKDPVLSKGFLDKSKTTRKPRISSKDMFELFKLNFINNKSMSISDIILRVKELNNDFRLMNQEKFFGRKKVADLKLRQYETAKEIGFFLNLDSKYTPETWIRMI